MALHFIVVFLFKAYPTGRAGIGLRRAAQMARQE